MNMFSSFYPYFSNHVLVSDSYLLNRKTQERILFKNDITKDLIKKINGKTTTNEILSKFGQDSEEVLRFLYNNGYLFFSREKRITEDERKYHLHSVNIEITKNCNLKCIYCYNNSGSSAYNEMNKQEWIKGLKLLKKHGVSVISFTGGDPFVKEKFEQILNFAVSNFQVHISTNGVKLSEILSQPEKYKNYIESLKKVWYISISMDSMNPSINDAFRGYGTHAKVLRAIILARALNIPIEIGVVDHLLSHEEKEIVNFARKVGASISYTGLEIRGRAKKHNLEYLIPKEYKVFRGKKYKEKTFEVSCPALYGELTIQPNGYFKPCLNPSELFEKVSSKFTKSFHVFDLKTKTPADIPFIKLIKEAKYVNCPNPICPHFHEICGICLVLRYYYHKLKYCR